MKKLKHIFLSILFVLLIASPVWGGTVTQANMRLSGATSGAVPSFVDFSAANVLTDYIGYKLTITDNASKTMIGYIKAAGTAETYSSELITAWTNSPTSPYETLDVTSPPNITSAINTTGSGSVRTPAFVSPTAKLYKLSVDVTQISGSTPKWYVSTSNILLGETASFIRYYMGMGTDSFDYSLNSNATNFSAVVSLKQVTAPSATGVTIVSAYGGNTYNWASMTTGFNQNDTSYTYALVQGVADPTFDNGTATYNNDVSVTISCTTSGATICYTTDGTDPTATTPGTCANGTTYIVPVSITATATTLKAIGTKADMVNSLVSSATYTLTNAAVIASPVAGTYLPSNSVTLSTTTTSGTIRYTTNGDTPDCPSTGTLYSAPFTTATTQTVKAIGCKTNYNASAVLSAVYTIREARSHYVSNAGLDSADGLSDSTPWRSISKINSSSFVPGDSILLNKSDTWRHSPTIPSAGTVGAPLTVSSYGTGNKPIIMGGDSASAGWEVIRNGQLIEYTDNGASNDDFLGFTTNWGGSVKADVVAGVVSARLSRVGARAYIVTTDIWLPANTEVSLTYDAKWTGHAGTFVYIKANATYDATTTYLKSDYTWTAAGVPATHQFASGGLEGTWNSEVFTFTTDNYTGNYKIGFATGNTENDALYIKNLSISLSWSSYVGGTGTKYKIPISYSALRFLRYDGNEWIPLLKGTNKDTLADMGWIYEAPYVYFRSDTDAPSAQTLVFSFGAGVINIVITSKNYVTIDGLAVILGGINSTYSTGTTVTNSDIYSNYFRGIVSGTDVSPVFTYNTVAYNGGNGFALYTTGGTVSNNIVKYNGYWGPDSYDGEGIGVGQDATGVTVSDNDIYGNNVNTAKVGNQLILWNANNCIVTRNKIHHGTSNGMAIAGNGNLISYNLVYANNVVTSEYVVNFRNNEAAPTVGGNKVYNNVFYGGGSTYGNMFIKGDVDYYNGWPNNEFKNNIVWRGSTKSYYTDAYFTDTGSVFDYNIIGPEGTNFIRWKGSNYYSTLAAFAAAQSQDAHSLSSDPLFVDAANGDFHLQSSSPTINAGVDVGLTGDYVGRQIQLAPDIGAYETETRRRRSN